MLQEDDDDDDDESVRMCIKTGFFIFYRIN